MEFVTTSKDNSISFRGEKMSIPAPQLVFGCITIDQIAQSTSCFNKRHLLTANILYYTYLTYNKNYTYYMFITYSFMFTYYSF